MCTIICIEIRNYNIFTIASHTEIPNPEMLDVMIMLNSAWNHVTVETIVNCLKNAGISFDTQASALNEEDDPFLELQGKFEGAQEC